MPPLNATSSQPARSWHQQAARRTWAYLGIPGTPRLCPLVLAELGTAPEPACSCACSQPWWHLPFPRVPGEGGRRGQRASTHQPVRLWQLLLSNPNTATTAAWQQSPSRGARGLKAEPAASARPGRCRCPAKCHEIELAGQREGGCAAQRCAPRSAVPGGWCSWGQLCTLGSRGTLGPRSPPPSCPMQASSA